MVMPLIWLAAAAAQPSPEALKLGAQIAESGTLATILPMMQMKETDELIKAHPELSQSEKLGVMAISQRVFEAGRDRVLQAEAASYARRMSIDDLRAVAAFVTSPAGQRYKDARSDAVEDVMPVIATMDFKRDVSTEVCKQTGKLCAK